jgi:transcriptional regulator with XRE-family HTH domain
LLLLLDFQAFKTGIVPQLLETIWTEMLVESIDSLSYNKNQNIQICNILHIILLIMGKTIPTLLPRVARLLEGFGANLKLARLRRKYSADSVAQRAGITRRTLSKVEQGDPGVALGVYTRVMQVLRLEGDLAQLAVDDVLGRKLQDAGMLPKRRAPKKQPLLSVGKGPEMTRAEDA